MLKVTLHAECEREILEWAVEIQVAAYRVIQGIALEAHRFQSKLVNHSKVGNLTGFFKAYVDHDPNRYPELPARYRLVFQLLPDPKTPKHLYVIAFGERDGLEVYHRAAMRLRDQG